MHVLCLFSYPNMCSGYAKVLIQKGSACSNSIESITIFSRLKKINTVHNVKFISIIISISFSLFPQTMCCWRSSR